ncbi:hypothetical protein DOTSEDRAFT_59390 [Dothistroma septosporum NZE10]|uniref:Ribosomal RNA-processing protein 1 n=1 Tax=Dothistroma septosporum (strain NZE10 / CBS 128990) TaxID=675120 RepID=N1Q5G0_DOTSN|nr:hypothetical protein DOTSEDRAFT_59390 [Dothistroma septosporum NZE10]
MAVSARTATESSTSNNPFIRSLASSNRTARDQALESLRTYLTRLQSFTSLDLLKIWKGLYYSMFMSDKPRNQQRLARDMADLTDCFTTFAGKVAWMGSFWTTMSREWKGIDSLRMDKYLYLIRCHVNKGFVVCQKTQWSEKVVEDYNEVVGGEGGPLSARDAKVPIGLRLHVLDIWVDELEKVDVERVAPVKTVMEPMRTLSKDSLVKSVRVRAGEQIEDDRLADGKAWAEPTEENEAEEEKAAGDNGDFGGFDD